MQCTAGCDGGGEMRPLASAARRRARSNSVCRVAPAGGAVRSLTRDNKFDWSNTLRALALGSRLMSAALYAQSGRRENEVPLSLHF